MKILISLLLFSLSSHLLADDELASSICRTHLKSTQLHRKPKTSFNFLFNFTFNPQSLVEIKELKSTTMRETVQAGSKRIFFNLIPEITLSTDEKIELRLQTQKIRGLKEELRKEDFLKRLQQQKNLESCLQYVKKTEILKILVKLDQAYKNFAPLYEKDKNAKAHKLIHTQLKSFEKKHWEVYSNLHLNEIHSLILDNPRSSIVLVAHATPNGELVDPYGNTLPPSFFINTNISNLLVYSCYPDQVSEFHAMRGNASIQQYFYPKARPMVSDAIGGSKIPMNSLRSILKIPFLSSSDESKKDLCTLRGDIRSASMGIFLNKKYLGMLRHEMKFDCNLLQGTNIVEIYQTSKTSRTFNLGLQELHLNDHLKIPIKEYTSGATNNHIVSKGSINLKGEI